MSVFSLQRIINVRDGYVLDLSPDRRQDALFGAKNSFNAPMHPDFTGRAIVSDPSSLIAMIVNDARSDTAQYQIFAGLVAKSGLRSSGRTLRARYCDIGYYPYLVNYVDASIPFETRFKSIGGYPSGILESFYKREYGNVKYFGITAFTWNEVLYMIFDCQNVPELKISMEFYSWYPDAFDLSAAYEEVNGQGTIWIQDHTTGLWVATACTNMNEYQVSDTPINPTFNGLDETQNSVSHTRACVALGTSGMPDKGRVVFCISMGKTKDGVQNAVVNGVQNWETALQQAEEFWASYFTDVNKIWFAPDELKVRGYFALNQLAALQYNGFLSAGMPNWYFNWLRDTSWVIHSLVRARPSLARDLLVWFKDTTITNANDYDMDKVGEFGYNNTDNAAVFLAAAGKYWKHTKDTDALLEIKAQLDQALAYATENYSSADKHILAKHAHDYWDDYVPEIDVSQVKYESMVDVLWLYALELMAPAYYALGDLTRRQDCIDIATGLRDGLEDYRRSDGGLEYAIKTDDTLYNDVLALPDNIFAAWLLNDEQCRQWMKKRETVATLGMFGSNLNWAVVFSQYASTYGQKEHAWFPHFPIVALLAAKEGDYQPMRLLLDSFPFGALPEYVKTSYDWGFSVMYGSHAWTFAWSYASVLELLNEFLVSR